MFRQVSGEKGDDLPAHAAHTAVSLHPQREVCMSLNSTVDGEVQAHLHTISTITSVYPPTKTPDQHDTHVAPRPVPRRLQPPIPPSASNDHKPRDQQGDRERRGRGWKKEGKEGILLTSAHSHHVWLRLDEELIRVHGQLSLACLVIRGPDDRENQV